MGADNREKLSKILDTLSIDYDQITRNALNVGCPFCSDHGMHAGIFVDSLTFTCWKCKTGGSLYDLLTAVCGLSYADYMAYMESEREFDVDKSTKQQLTELIRGKKIVETGPRDVEWPLPGSVPIQVMKTDSQVMAFLALRKLSFEECHTRGVHIGVTGRYAGRIIIPVLEDGVTVAYQARDMTDTDKAKYLTGGDVSYFLYGIDEVDPSQPVGITEGIFDEWATPNSMSSFSTSLSDEQIVLLRLINAPLYILCWDIGQDGSDAYWKSRPVIANLKGVFGADKIGSVLLPKGSDPDKLGSERMLILMEEAIERCKARN